MTTASSTSITVRVQAKGGKFLADDIGGAEVTIRDAQTGEWLAGGLALGTDSGNLSDLYSTAVQLSTGNTGTGTVTFFIKNAAS